MSEDQAAIADVADGDVSFSSTISAQNIRMRQKIALRLTLTKSFDGRSANGSLQQFLKRRSLMNSGPGPTDSK